MRVLFLSNDCDKFRTQICLLVKRELEKLFPRADCKILVLKEIQMSYFSSIFDKRTIDFAKEVIKKFGPHVIVVTRDTGPAPTFIKLGRMMKIPTLAIQSVLLTESPYLGESVYKTILHFLKWKNYLLWRFLSRLSRISFAEKLTVFIGWRTRALDWGLGGADLYAVMGNYSKQLLVSRGISPQKIKVTGNPLFDEVHFRSDFEKEKLRRRLRLGKGNIILLATQPFVEDRSCSLSTQIMFVESVIDAAKQLRLQLVIKLHPREDVRKYDSVIHQTKYDKVVFVENYDLHELIDISDVVITATSTTGLWALAHGKPLVSINFIQLPCFNIYKDIAINLNNLEKLPEVLKKVIGSGKAGSELMPINAEKVRNYIYMIDGLASRRVAQLIIDLITGGNWQL
jgi:hypothetical protein